MKDYHLTISQHYALALTSECPRTSQKRCLHVLEIVIHPPYPTRPCEAPLYVQAKNCGFKAQNCGFGGKKMLDVWPQDCRLLNLEIDGCSERTIHNINYCLSVKIFMSCILSD